MLSGSSVMSATPPSAVAEGRSALESLLGPQEAMLLRLSDESKQLSNELVELRFKHCLADDAASVLGLRIDHLDTIINQSASDRCPAAPPRGVRARVSSGAAR